MLMEREERSGKVVNREKDGEKKLWIEKDRKVVDGGTKKKK